MIHYGLLLLGGSSDQPQSQQPATSMAPSGGPSFVAPSFTITTSPAATYPPEPFMGGTRPPAPRMTPLVTQPHLIGTSPDTHLIGAGGGPVPVAAGAATVAATPTPVTGPPFLPPENMINYATGAPALVPGPPPHITPAFQAFTPVVSWNLMNIN